MEMMMINEDDYRAEMSDAIGKAVAKMCDRNSDVEVYTVSVWTDVKARKSSVSVDTFSNSEIKRSSVNAYWQDLRNRFSAEGNFKRLALVPPDEARNENPADFEFRDIVLIDNASLTDVDWISDHDWDVVERLLREVQRDALTEFRKLKLHSNAELGINSRTTWYCHPLKI